MNNLNIEVAKLWLKAFNEHNLEALLSLYDEKAEHYSPKLKIRQPETQGFIKGKSALRAWWLDAFERLPSLQYIPQSLTANNDRVFMEYVRKVQGEEETKVAEVLEIKNGLIIYSRVYHG